MGALRRRLYRCHYTLHTKIKDSGPVLRPISTSEQRGGECITATEAGTTWGRQRKKEVRERLVPILLHEINLQRKKKSHGSLNSRSIICHRPCCGPKVQLPFWPVIVECFPMTRSHSILDHSQEETEDSTPDMKDCLDIGNEIQPWQSLSTTGNQLHSSVDSLQLLVWSIKTDEGEHLQPS